MRARTALTLIVLAVAAGVIVDRVWIANALPSLSMILTVKPRPTFFGRIFFPDARVGMLPVLAITLMAVGGVMVPFQALRNRAAWLTAWRSWRVAAIWVVLLPFLALVGGFLFEAAEDYLPAWAVTVAKGFGFSPTFFSFDTEIVPLDANIGSVLGAAVGLAAVVAYMKSR